MVRKIMLLVALSLFVALVSLPASASLVPMSWGFPQLAQTSTLTAFDRSFAQSTASDAAAVAFPTAGNAYDGVFSSAFPTITQTAAKNDLLSQCRFMNQQETFAFAYPYLSIGGSPVPSMGFL
jgi:hypothetical protein